MKGHSLSGGFRCGADEVTLHLPRVRSEGEIYPLRLGRIVILNSAAAPPLGGMLRTYYFRFCFMLAPGAGLPMQNLERGGDGLAQLLFA